MIGEGAGAWAGKLWGWDWRGGPAAWRGGPAAWRRIERGAPLSGVGTDLSIIGHYWCIHSRGVFRRGSVGQR
jgi:hypothetical protein